MPARLSIFHKGLVLIAVPLVIQLGLIWLVYNTQARQVEAQRRSAHTKEVLAQAGRILTLLVEEQTGVRGFLITNNPFFAEPYERATRELPAALERLPSLVTDNPPQYAKAKQIASKADAIYRWHASMVREIQNGDLEMATARLKTGQGNNQTNHLRQEIAAFMAVEEELDRRRDSTLQATQQRLRWLLGAGTVTSFLGTLGLSLVFYRGIGGRLTMLTENARRLADGKELIAAIDGSDEIAVLDKAFHESAQKLADSQKAIREEKDLLNTVLNSMGEGLVVADARGNFLVFNPAAAQLFGKGPEGTSPERWSKDLGVYLADGKTLFPPEDLPLARALRNESVDDVELAIRPTHRQEPIWITVSARPLPSASGRPGGGVAVFRDITERRKAEAAIRQLNEELEQRVEQRTAELTEANRDLTQKNQENEMFVYSVSHDLRSPLVSLQGFSRELGLVGQELRTLLATDAVPADIRTKASAVLDGDMQQSLKFIQTGVLRLSNIIDALLRLSRIGRVEYEFRCLNMSEIIGRVIEAMSAELFERGVDIRIHDLPPCYGDATAVEQLFANLIGNAMKYLVADRKGEIEIGAVRTPATDASDPGTSQTYYVKDNGLGIPAAYQEKIFQAFQRVHPRHAPGEGMGLAIVRRIVQRHLGRVWVDSTEGQGSTFFVTLPTRAPADGLSVNAVRPENGEKSNGERTHGDLVGGRR